MTSPILLTGGTGTLGRLVLPLLRDAGGKVARVSLDMLRSRTSRREELHGAHSLDLDTAADGGTGPENDALLADAVGSALLVVLDTPGACRAARVRAARHVRRAVR